MGDLLSLYSIAGVEAVVFAGFHWLPQKRQFERLIDCFGREQLGVSKTQQTAENQEIQGATDLPVEC
jgi:hypothetical protein